MKTPIRHWDIRSYLVGNKMNFPRMESDFSFIKTLSECMQDSKHHSEGDVWKHTKMSLESLPLVDGFRDLSDKEQGILYLATLLHDIGKPQTTTVEENKITSKRHSVVGARLVREMLWGRDKVFDAPWDVREIVSNLALLHMLPVYFFEKEDPVYSISASSQVIKNKWLSILSMADILGRICSDTNIQKNTEDTIKFFSQFCIENECYDKPKEFKSDLARFRYFFERNGHPDFDRYEKTNGTVTMMSGLQGSGKSFLIEKFYKNQNVVGIDESRDCLGVSFGEDEGEVAQYTKEKCREEMREHKDFVFNATNTIKDIRGKWIRLFRQYGYRINIHYVEKPWEITLKQNRNREEMVPEGIIHEKFKRLDVPTILECHNLLTDVPQNGEIC